MQANTGKAQVLHLSAIADVIGTLLAGLVNNARLMDAAAAYIIMAVVPVGSRR